MGNEDGTIPYENWNVLDRHGYLRWRPVEADAPLHRGHWFWHPNDQGTLRMVVELTRTYDETIGRGGQLMLGLAPDTSGVLPEDGPGWKSRYILVRARRFSSGTPRG